MIEEQNNDKIYWQVIPAIMGALEPILPILLMDTIQSVDIKDLVSHLAQTVQKSSFQVSAITQFKNLDFINIGELPLFFVTFRARFDGLYFWSYWL